MNVLHERLSDVLEIVHEAGAAIMAPYNSRTIESTMKADGTVVTQADRAAHIILSRGLAEVCDVPILSEEGDPDENREIATADHFLAVDPLDNSAGYNKYMGQFMIGGSEVRDGVPVGGFVHDPLTGETYWGGPGLGSFKQIGDADPEPLQVRGDEPTGIVMVNHGEVHPATLQYIEWCYPEHERQPAGSYLKYLRVAEGLADAYPRPVNGMFVWDAAPGHAILTGAGGMVVRPDGAEIDYRSPDQRAGGFIASSGAVPILQTG